MEQFAAECEAVGGWAFVLEMEVDHSEGSWPPH